MRDIDIDVTGLDGYWDTVMCFPRLPSIIASDSEQPVRPF